MAISEVTDLYYAARQYPENSGERKKYCATAEKKLQDLSRNYREKEQQRRIELLLAWNAEFLDETEKAALYYENLLLYDAEYRVVYGEYGMFLFLTVQGGFVHADIRFNFKNCYSKKLSHKII